MSATEKQIQEDIYTVQQTESINKEVVAIVARAEALSTAQRVERSMRIVASQMSVVEAENAMAGIDEAIRTQAGLKRDLLFERGVEYIRDVNKADSRLRDDGWKILSGEDLRAAYDEAERLVQFITSLQSLACGGTSVELNGDDLYSLLENLHRQAQDVQDMLT